MQAWLVHLDENPKAVKMNLLIKHDMEYGNSFIIAISLSPELPETYTRRDSKPEHSLMVCSFCK